MRKRCDQQVMAKQAVAWRHNRTNGSRGKSKGREKEMKFATQSQMSRGNYGTYTSVKDVIVQEVQRKYKHGSDMAKSIQDGKLFDIDSVRPTRILSELDKTDERAIEQAGLDILFQEELRAFIDRKMLLNENKCKRTA